SGNLANGILLEGAGTSGTMIQANEIGTNAAGTAALANGNDGILIQSGANNNTIGGTAFGAGNVISGNLGNGITITDSGTTGNVVEGNYIGTNAAGTGALG